MKFDKNDISDKMVQAAFFAMACETEFENRLAGRRDLDNYAKVLGDKGEARRAIKLGGEGNQPPPDVDQLKLRWVTSDLRDEASEGGSDTGSLQKLAESLSANVEPLNTATKVKSKGKSQKEQWNQRASVGGQRQGASQRQNAKGDRQPWIQLNETGRTTEKPQDQGRRRECREGSRKGDRRKRNVCGGTGHPAVRDGFTTSKKERSTVRTPMRTAAGPRRMTRHSNWSTLATMLM